MMTTSKAIKTSSPISILEAVASNVPPPKCVREPIEIRADARSNTSEPSILLLDPIKREQPFGSRADRVAKSSLVPLPMFTPPGSKRGQAASGVPVKGVNAGNSVGTGVGAATGTAAGGGRTAGAFEAGTAMGRPACAMLPQALNSTAAVASVGCIGNRVYTDLGDDELYLAVPARALDGTLGRLETILVANAELEKFHRQRATALA